MQLIYMHMHVSACSKFYIYFNYISYFVIVEISTSFPNISGLCLRTFQIQKNQQTECLFVFFLANFEPKQ